MEKIIRWFVSNKVVSNLLMVLILVTGATTIPSLKMEVFPEIELNIISVTTVSLVQRRLMLSKQFALKLKKGFKGWTELKKSDQLLRKV